MTGLIEFPRRNSLMYLCSYVKKQSPLWLLQFYICH